MRLTAFTDYSLGGLIFVAAAPDGRATVPQIAQALEVSENHLVKVVHFLGQCGFLATTRGRGGGLRLGRPAADINVGDVVRQAEGDAVPAECFTEATNTCVITRGCRLRGVLKEAVSAFEGVLDRYTLADLVHNRSGLQRVLRIVPVSATTK
jgi:Rrf2 family nitric oxide-sensitive transcriptional repressor